AATRDDSSVPAPAEPPTIESARSAHEQPSASGGDSRGRAAIAESTTVDTSDEPADESDEPADESWHRHRVATDPPSPGVRGRGGSAQPVRRGYGSGDHLASPHGLYEAATGRPRLSGASGPGGAPHRRRPPAPRRIIPDRLGHRPGCRSIVPGAIRRPAARRP